MTTTKPAPRWRPALGLLTLVVAVAGASEAWRNWSSARLGAEVAAAAKPGDIEMLASDTCPYCVRARAWFGANKIAFSECSIEREPACAARFEALRAPGTPVLLVRGKPQVGFDPQRVAQALGAV